MSDTQQLPLSIQPVISYPREAQVGKTYLMTVDLQPSGNEWPYEEEEYPIYCMLETSPLFSSKPMGEPAVVLHRFGGTYGAAKFLLTAAQEEIEGEIRVTLVNGWGVPVRVLNLDDINITNKDTNNNPIGSIFLERTKHLEQRIADYQESLHLYSRETFPEQWAETQQNLAVAYLELISGNRTENIEQALLCLRNALQVYTQAAFPVEWATTKMNLGNAYRDRIRGDKANNLEEAIAAYRNALMIHTRDAFPVDWAMIIMNRGNACRDRIMGDKAQNIEEAITDYRYALEVQTREAFPIDWATTQMNLGNAYRERIMGDKADNLEEAIVAYRNALEVQTREAFPIDWAMIQMNLGTAYRDRIIGNKADNLEEAIAAYRNALMIHTRDAFPVDWAMIIMNRGNAYRDRIMGDKAQNIEEAITLYRNALEVFTRDAFPQKNAQTLLNLGLAYQTSNQLHLAHDTFEAAIETVELLRGEIHSGNVTKQKLAEEWNSLYQSIVAVCLEMSRYTEAIEYVERSKTRNLVELILRRELHNLFPPEIAIQLQQIENEIVIAQDQVQNYKTDELTVLAQRLMQLRQRRNELQNRYLPIGAGFRFDQFQAVLDKHTAIIEWFITDDKIIAFIVQPYLSKGQRVSVWQSTADELQALVDFTSTYLQKYNNEVDNWNSQLELRLEELSNILHLDEILTQLSKTCNQLILIPHRFLHIFPLHALPVIEKSCLLDYFYGGVRYAPSYQVLQLVQGRQRPDFTNLFAVQNPTADLHLTDLEVNNMRVLFKHSHILIESAATKAAVKEAPLNTIHCLHFCGHGYFNRKNPWESQLVLAEAPVETVKQHHSSLPNGEVHDRQDRLTLAEIYSLNLEQCRLVTLSACETGLIDFTNTSDEYIGFSGAFLCAGSAKVVSPLWRLHDFSTTLLMIRFYHNLQSESTVAVALNQAQIWLREVTTEELEEWTSHLSLTATQKFDLFNWFRKMQPKQKPFQSPYYWAAFCVIG